MGDRFLDALDTLTSHELTARREALGLSQEAMGEALGVKQATISNWEGGKRGIPEGIGDDLAELEDLQDSLVDQIVELVEHRSALHEAPTVRWDQPPPEGAPQGLVDRAVTMAARFLRQEHEITLRF